ncbi:adenylate/guanylate cyclase domain-containing protein [Leptospira idonii]|uniref:Adenylate/guanylate cyclase domain-containing protein n=1 Tax=Leptospira idonii TaxID=1193500 RepID=A0A4R9M5H8_9LEPT|nr:adenylate/guanylate cyclase domain-containing protein [Leptospira idonii]TGN19988.1 adenylate/guanylate cyclase domain-containing protein [Leptospira idonii]
MRLSFLFLSLVFLVHCNEAKSELPLLIQGSLDVSERDWEQDGSFSLKGDAEFYWKKFVSHSDFIPSGKGKPAAIEEKDIIYKYIPAVWNGTEINGEKIPGHGYGSYRLKIKFSPGLKKKMAFRISDQAHAYRLFVDGVLVVESGTVGESFETMRPDARPRIYSFETQNAEMELIFHVSNFHHRVGGLRYDIRLGTEEKILFEIQKSFLIEAFLYGGFFIISLYHFAIYFFRRKSPAPLYFGIFCIAVLFYSIITGERLFYYYFPESIGWENRYRLEFILICMISVFFLSFFTELYKDVNTKYLPIAQSINVLNCGFAFFTLFSEPVVFTEYLVFMDVLRIATGIYIISNLVYFISQKREGSVLFLLGILFIFACAINDMLTGRSVINTPRLAKYGLTVMILLQAIMIAKVFTRDFLMAERLSLNLSKTNRAYSRFVPREFLNLLEKKTILDINLGDHVQREMTILFSDIRSFTSLSEKMSPSENFHFLNSYLNKIAPVIETNKGFIDKYLGDAIMGLFPEHADNALEASISIQREIYSYNRSREQSGKSPLKVGIGLHTGNLILGTIGHVERMEGTVISDSVNLASRIEGLTKYYGSNILISEDTFHALKDPKKYNVRLLDNVMVHGKETSTFVIEVLDGYPEELQNRFLENRKDFEIGHLLYKEKAFHASIEFFKKVIESNPYDSACAFYLKRAEFYDKFGAPPEWDGIEVFNDK